MKTQFQIGDKVKVSPDNDNENYDHFRDKVLTITHVATSTKEHPGYDNALEDQALYDFNGIGCSLYDYELIKA